MTATLSTRIHTHVVDDEAAEEAGLNEMLARILPFVTACCFCRRELYTNGRVGGLGGELWQHGTCLLVETLAPGVGQYKMINKEEEGRAQLIHKRIGRGLGDGRGQGH